MDPHRICMCIFLFQIDCFVYMIVYTAVGCCVCSVVHVVFCKFHIKGILYLELGLSLKVFYRKVSKMCTYVGCCIMYREEEKKKGSNKMTEILGNCLLSF